MLRLLIFGVSGSPTIEISERISNFYNISFLYIENSPLDHHDYFSDDIPEVSFDTGDFSSGSEHQQYYRDPSSSDYDKILDKITSVVNTSIDFLPVEELSNIFKLKQGIIVTEIPDINLVRWATHIIYLYSSEDSAVSWFSDRLKCMSCGNVHHLEDKPPKISGICDRCGSDLIKLESDQPQFVRSQYRNWDNYFWKFKEYSKDNNYKVLNIDKFDNLESIYSHVDYLVRDSIEDLDWYNLMNFDNLSLNPLDGPFVWNPLTGELEEKH